MGQRPHCGWRHHRRQALLNAPTMNLLDGAQIARYLERCGLIDENSRVTAAPLSGGVSSDVALAACGDRRWVLKQGLPKLKVAQDWRAGPMGGRLWRWEAFWGLCTRTAPAAAEAVLALRGSVAVLPTAHCALFRGAVRAVSGSAAARARGDREFSDVDRCSAGQWGLQSQKCHCAGGRQKPDCIGLGGGPPGPPRI